MAHQYHSLSTLFLCALLFIHNPTSIAVARGQEMRVSYSNPQPGRNITGLSASCGKLDYFKSGKKNFQPAVELYAAISLHKLATVVFAWPASGCASACENIVSHTCTSHIKYWQNYIKHLTELQHQLSVWTRCKQQLLGVFVWRYGQCFAGCKWMNESGL